MITITTPSNVTLSTTGLNAVFAWDSGFGSGYTKQFYQAQRRVDSEVLRYNTPYVPFDTGTLQQSGILNTVIGSGEVVYQTPYARRMYYNPQYNFQGAPQRGAYWFERMKADHKDDILRAAGKEFRK